jgi:hypothetical protein
MENVKLNQLLAKLDILPIENPNVEFEALGNESQYLISIYGGDNLGCSNSSCQEGSNRGCVNSGCGNNTENKGCHNE